ncbi:hypothetical protein pdam_00020481 [Pocillopora damicornis]|uniref:Uncharacterized protein n=1 Tax=Pocillopora damicornis TaxID=46731 RepID=A0A3M6TPM6_POCDA|nr:hypothetical protein pdam_00020481 [Pocillopora damicornis]
MMMMMMMKHYTEPSPGFAATPKTIVTSPKDPAWTLGAKGVQGSGSSDEEEPFITPRDVEILQMYNTAMSKLAMSSSSADNFSPLTSRLKTSWENITELDRQKSQEKPLQVCLLVYEVSARASEDDLSEELSALMTAYRDAPREKTGQKASTEQVAKDMRNARTYDNQRRFGREEWLTKLQVQGFFSPLASSRRRQGWHVADTSEEYNEGDEVGEQRHVVEEVTADPKRRLLTPYVVMK